MLHPALARALATARIEDQLRAAARWHTIRLARRARAPRGGHSNRGTATRVDSTTSTAPAQPRGMTRTETLPAPRWPCESVIDARSGPRAGIDRASNEARPASSHTRTSGGSE
jgi:hypothetical protein